MVMISKFNDLEKKNTLIRFGIVISCFTIWIFYRLFSQVDEKKWDYIYCFEDRLLTEFFLNTTIYISQNLWIRDFLLIAGSAFLDIFMVSFLVVYVIRGYSWGPLLHMALFYGLRGAVIQNLVIMQIYDTYVFEHPGFPSLIVPYFRAADFFYSGHTGCAILLGMQLADMGYPELKYVGIIISVFEGLILTVLRIHYSIDIVFGIIASHYIYYVSKFIAYYFDRLIPMTGEEGEVKGDLVEHYTKKFNDELKSNRNSVNQMKNGKCLSKSINNKNKENVEFEKNK